MEEVAVDTNCGLLGDYKPATHECRCDIGWTGRNCTLPSLELAPVATTSSQAYVILLCRVRLVISPSLISRTPAQPCRTVARTAPYDPRWCSQACSPSTIGRTLLSGTDALFVFFWGCRYINVTAQSWGGGAIQGADGTYSLFAAEMDRGCGLGDFNNNSQIIHATASHPAGPYSRRGVVRVPFVRVFRASGFHHMLCCT